MNRANKESTDPYKNINWYKSLPNYVTFMIYTFISAHFLLATHNK